MRVRVAYAVEVSEELRRAIRRMYGRKGTATRQEAVVFLVEYGSRKIEALLAEFGDAAHERAEKERATANPPDPARSEAARKRFADARARRRQGGDGA